VERDRRRPSIGHHGDVRRISVAPVTALLALAAALLFCTALQPALGAGLPGASPVAPLGVSPSASAASVAANPTLPLKMRHLPAGCRQIVVITGARLGSKSGTLALYNKTSAGWVRVISTAADFGAKGLVNGLTRRQGHLQTPTGIWSLGTFVFGEPRTAPSGTKMPYRRITPTVWWSARPGSTYNTWVSSSRAIAGERLASSPVQYHYALNTGFNALPNSRVIGRGTAIFIHCSEPAGNALGKYTHGCVAIPRTVMATLVTALDPALHPYCAIGTLVSGTSTSIYAY
jgi:L,D-peptidoglycan transpeptidase YkuD (ErfK/YbiS/YcfS/YnhG family)